MGSSPARTSASFSASRTSLVLPNNTGQPALVAVALFFVLAMLLAPPADGQRRMAVVRGTVVDQDGNPLQGVTVSAEFWYMGPRLTIGAAPAGERESINQIDKRSGNDRETREDGTFSIPDLNSEIEYRVRLQKEGYIPREEKKIFRVGGNDLGTFVMISGNVEVARRGYEDGYAAFEAGNCGAAVGSMEEVVGVFGDSDSSDEMLVVALGVLGQCYLQQGRSAEAGTVLTRLLGIRLDNAIAHRGLGQVAAMQGDMAKALEHFDIAVQLEPESAVGRYLFGYALQLSGQAGEAIPHLEACLEANPGFIQARKSLGMALADSGDADGAIEQLEAYLEQAPNAPDAAEVEAKLAELRLK